MENVVVKKMPLPDFGFQKAKDKNDWVVIFHGDIFGRYPTKAAATADVKKYNLND